MGDLFQASVFKRCKNGIKLLGKGIEEFKDLGLPFHFEVSDAS